MADGGRRAPDCRCCGIDVHAHVVPENFPAYLGSKRAGAMAVDGAGARPCHRSVMIAGKVYRTVSRQVLGRRRERLADLPAMGLALQAISPMPELLSYWMDAGRCAAAAALPQRADRGDGRPRAAAP